jgi:predicted DNA-binding protein
MAEKTSAFNIREFPVKLRKRLKGVAKKEGRTMTWLVIAAVTEYLNRLEREGGK